MRLVSQNENTGVNFKSVNVIQKALKAIGARDDFICFVFSSTWYLFYHQDLLFSAEIYIYTPTITDNATQ